jgi:glycosyltransferase involved in cell wall biosynthesis
LGLGTGTGILPRVRYAAAVPSPATAANERGTARPDLSAVIPVHNAADCLTELVRGFRGVEDLDVEVVLVDDGSTDGGERLIDNLAERDDRIVTVHHGTNLGAGVARNSGFAQASGRYTIFFDADDVLHPSALGSVVAELDRSGADVVMTTYRYRRSAVLETDAMNRNDVAIWQEYLTGASERLVYLSDAPQLLEFTNYPWNKIIRTTHYKESGLRFGSTLVHNDILGHWHSLLFAGRILLSSLELCTHVVERGAQNLTNINQRSRLTLFDALDETYALLEATPHLRSRYASNYWSFVLRVTGWAASEIHPPARPEFDERLKAHLLRIHVDDFMRMRIANAPLLADRIVNRVIA